MEGDQNMRKKRRVRAETLHAMRTLKDYEIYLREMDTIDEQAFLKKKRRRMFCENLAHYQIESEKCGASMNAIRDLTKKFKRIEHRLNNIKVSVLNDVFDIDKPIAYGAYKSFLDMSDLNKPPKRRKEF